MRMLLSNEFVTVARPEGKPWLEVIWHGYGKGKPYRDALDKALVLLKNEGLDSWLADMRNASVIDPEDLEWVNTNWAPRAVAAGLRWVAMVFPERSIPRMQVQRIERAGVPVEEMKSAFFTKVEEARNYLDGA